MYTALLHQYQFVKGSREALLNYCVTLSPEHLNQPVAEFNNRSIGFLLTHVANVYLHWIDAIAQNKQPHYFDDNAVHSVASLKQSLDLADVSVNDFLQYHKDNLETPAQYTIPARNQTHELSPLQIFTHVTTHEFHHKGQILSMSRILGYTPVDTDIIRT
ncbi:DUF664 domain-containing protein [Mucilaginibacter pallidiroseus]|uniref:DUF664 domain-containing protein n=1 Tax=Mucilaginibacter pallidiroseus TaxID=2599295 RepID=A0A563U0H0_9SPHI|nr:DinB family protein [Mucilaginibacter pallidiroseus]TWR25127.1 DUF664 domain-containing protein [Mucilaginibacter pallidiroseus]